MAGSIRARTTLVAATTCLGALITARGAHASPQDLFGYGPRPMAMGGAGATFADDWSAVHANPAGLSRAREGSFSLGFVGGAYDVFLQRGQEATAHYPIDAIRGTTIGATLPLPFQGILRNRVVVGIGFYTPTAVVVRARIFRPEQPQFVNIEDRAQSVAIQAGIGFDLGRGFRAGFGFSALAAVVGNVLIATDASGRAGSRVDNQLVASYAPVIGVSWERGPFRAGFTYRGALEGRFDVVVRTMNIGLPLPDLNITGTAQFDPRQYAFEVGYARGPLTLALGLTYKRWSRYAGPLVPTTRNSPDLPPINFADTLVPRIGAEYRWDFTRSYFAVRAGYFYEPTPAPDATEAANYLDTDRHVTTLGLGTGGRFRDTLLSLDLAAQLHGMPSRTSRKSATVPADNPGLPSLTYGGSMFVISLTGTVSF